ncbi:FAD-dependent oxidoreductase [Aliiroseovarius sp. M344]|uniref:GcvT family protein n=1 Tax=Aliiroseovarius sp. M344 TaxID=2867010 RepID=UPI0021AD6CB6|nr:FAD-dependent oxidoreductase [Aliiroseovarius sp. M344]UWQ14550.1 FAD-dependent oxidoreductase [Aliiroseovarius sp. M344]
MKSHAKVVVVGGGCVGASILYGLTQHGCSDAVMLERTQLTAGSTWHAAGLLVTFVRSHNVSKMTLETIQIYTEVEEKIGSSVGLRKVGQLRVANTPERWDEFQSYLSVAEAAGVPCKLLTPAEVAEVHPLLNQNENIEGGILHTEDGYVNPADITQAMAKLARDQGAKIYQNTEAQKYEKLPNGLWKVFTTQGEITCEHLIFATGNYARENARRVGLDLPCIPIVHQYWTTDHVPQLIERRKRGLREYPILRDEDYGAYLREDVGGLQFGPYEFEKDLKLFAEDRVPPEFGADLLPEDFDAVETQWERAIERVPVLGEVGIKANTRGPFQMTPDELPLAGPAPGHDNLWLAEGMPGGILWGGTVGNQLAQWILKGMPSIDMSELDPRRFGDYAAKRWTMDKVRETWGNHMHAHIPGEDFPSARPMRTVGSYDLLNAKGAVWTLYNGYEFPKWFAPTPEEAIPVHSFRRTDAWDYVTQEVRTTREEVGFIEMSPMTKFNVRGVGAATWLDRLMANKLPKFGRMTLSLMLNTRGGMDAEFTIVREGENDFYLVSTPNGQVYNWDVLSKLLPTDGSVQMQDVSEQFGVVALAGPKSREILQNLTDNELSNEAFPWLSAQMGEVGYAKGVRLLRVSYTGELGWEIHHPANYNRHIVDQLLKAGVRPFGALALESMRLEKSYRAINKEIRKDMTPYEADLGRFVALTEKVQGVVKDRNFIGKEALLEQKKKGGHRVLVTLKLPYCDTSVIADEAVYKNDRLVGRVTSGGFSYYLQHDIAMALVPQELSVSGTQLQVKIHNEIRDGEVIDICAYDPKGIRTRM